VTIISGTNLSAGVREGDVLAGKYRVERVLGTGGMGVVVAAHHLQLEERVALKFILPAALDNREAVARFSREARAMMKIKSEYVARILDVGTLPNSAPFMVMEYLEGGDLSTWLKQRGPLPIEQAVEFVIQACVAIADAHALGIVHRDLKPANLFCVRRSDGLLSIKVLDFGISKMSGLGSPTGTLGLMGSPLYMSPEQMQSSKDVDSKTDLWSLGIVLYELLTGTVPFPEENFEELRDKIAIQDPTPIRTHRPDVPLALDAVIRKCLQKDRTRRYSNVAELAVSLFPFGPKRAKALVERVSGIVQSAGLSASVLELPPSTQSQSSVETVLQPQTVAPTVGRTAALMASRIKTLVSPRIKILVMGATGLILAMFGLFLFSHRSTGTISNSNHASPPDQPSIPPIALSALPPSPPLPSLSPLSLPSLSLLPSLLADAAAPSPLLTPPHPPVIQPHVVQQTPPHVVIQQPSPPPPLQPPPQKSAPNCNPPWYTDSAGHKQYKPDCF
jgi:eukaryotic-like serine/threonine-protein kinase